MKKVSVRLENFEKTIGVFNAFKLRIDIFGQKDKSESCLHYSAKNGIGFFALQPYKHFTGHLAN